MNSLPEGVIQHILSLLRNARDIAAAASVSSRWSDCVPYIPALYFPRNVFERAPIALADATIARMVAAAVRLEELVIYCPFSGGALASWLALRSGTLRVLELRMDADPTRVDGIDAARGLEVLRLWGVSMARPPSWGGFAGLRVLEITGAKIEDDALKGVVRACPNLTELALLGFDGVDSVSIELQRLERCRIDFLGPGNASLFLSSPRLEELEIQGFGWVRVHPDHRLRNLRIAKNSGRVNKVEFGKLANLDCLSIRGVQWSWGAVCSVLQSATELKHLFMKIEFCGDFDTLLPFPELDLVEFFNHHQKLRCFEIHGAMFAALCHKNSLRNMDSGFSIPCLEDVVVTVRSPLNAEQKLNTLESLVKHSRKLRKMIVRISQMKNCHESADDFFDEICKFQKMNNKRVRIE